MASIRAAYNPGEGRHWFDADSMRFFRTKLPRSGVAAPSGKYFITQETNWDRRTMFTVRKQDLSTGDIDTLGDFHSYSTRADAQAALKAHLGA